MGLQGNSIHKELEEKPLVSIVLTPYNSKATLPLVLDAILKQTYPLNRLELIIVDGGSKDGTLEIIKRFLEENGKAFYRTRLIVHDKNYGVSKARNDGIREASGEYILILDADVVLPHNAIEELVKASKEQVGGCRCFGTLPILNNPDKLSELRYKLLIDRIAYSFAISESTLIPRELPQKIGYYDESLGPPWSNYEDLEYGARAWSSGYKICILGYLKSKHYSYEHDTGSFNAQPSQPHFIKRVLNTIYSYINPKYGYVVYRFTKALPARFKALWLSYLLEPSITIAVIITSILSTKMIIIPLLSLILVVITHYILVIREFWNPKHVKELLIYSSVALTGRILRILGMMLYLVGIRR